jgi:hypothetical protein
LPYRTWATNDIPSAADFNNLFADAVTADVATSQTTTSLGYTDLSTVGPTAAIAMVNGQQAEVTITARLYGSAGLVGPVASFSTSGAASVAATDMNGVENDGTTGMTCTRSTWVSATSTATLTATMKYKVTNAGTGTFLERRISVKKF